MDKDESKSIIPLERIESVIYVIRGQKIILDQDLAALYGAETKQLNRAVSRNKERFPEAFAFQLTNEEWNSLRCQIGTSNAGRGGRRYLPFVFTEHGVVMAANILKSKRAIWVSIEIARAFIRMRQIMTSHREMGKELVELKSFLLKHSNQTNREFKRIWNAIEKLAEPHNGKEQRKIGFDVS